MISFYYKGNSVRGQDESNRARILANRAGKMELSYPYRTTFRVQQENFPESNIINPLLIMLVRSR